MRVFKYRGGRFDRDLEALKENYFWAPSRLSLNDPCEGIFDRNFLFSQINILASLNKGDRKVRKYHKELEDRINDVLAFVDKCGIYSLSKTPFEELLWAHYADSHKGFCIEYDIKRLVSFEEHDYHQIPVTYTESPQALVIDDLIKDDATFPFLRKMLGNKSTSWSYEGEIRIVPSATGRHDFDYRAVKSIYFGLRMDEKEKIQLMEALKGRGVSYFNIELEENSYKFSCSRVDDVYSDAEKYMGDLAELPDYAITPNLVSEAYAPYIDYLYKAAEIVRREPYCNRIEMVEFSSSKGSPDNPVVFVQYERKKHRWVNHYLSLAEIDQQYAEIIDSETV